MAVSHLTRRFEDVVQYDLNINAIFKMSMARVSGKSDVRKKKSGRAGTAGRCHEHLSVRAPAVEKMLQTLTPAVVRHSVYACAIVRASFHLSTDIQFPHILKPFMYAQ